MAVNQTQLTELYLAYFGRPPDFDGLNFYLAQPNATLASVEANFSASPESIALYGDSDASLSNLINAIYNNLFNRDAEPAGLTFWSNAINKGFITKAGAAYEILKGAQNADKTAVANKMAVSNAFVAALNTTPEILGYSGDEANASARAFLHTVDSTPASLTAALAGVDAAVAAAVDLGGPEGVLFSLTAGKDVFVGGGGNDTIDAVPLVSTLGHDTTLDAFDSIDGGGGKDTLNIYTHGYDAITSTPANTVQQGTVKNVEIINIYNDLATFSPEGGIDASAFQGATEIWQRGDNESDVFDVAAGVTLGFGDIGFVNPDLSAAATVTSLQIELDGVGEGGGGLQGWIDTEGKALGTVNITGTLAQDTADDFNYIGVDINVGKNVTTAVLNTTVNVRLEVLDNSSGTKAITTVDASGSTGGVSFDAFDEDFNSFNAYGEDIATIKTGSGEDYVLISTNTAKDDVATPGDETVSAFVSTGAGNDFVDIYTNYYDPAGAGTTTVETGDGNDSVYVNTRGTGKLTVSLGAGDDEFDSGTPVIEATDAIDGGAGSDTLLLNLVGASNVGAFTGFEVFDAANLGTTFDMDILASKNTVTEVISSDWVGVGASLINLGAGVGYRATANNNDLLTLTQKTPGALSIALDVDQKADDADDSDDYVQTLVNATNATSITAKFDSSFVDDVDSFMAITALKATTLTIVSGGTNSDNELLFTHGLSSASTAGTDGLLTTVTVTGTQHLVLDLAPGKGVTPAEMSVTVNASASTGGLTFNTNDLKDKGSVTLGSGVDHISVDVTSTQGAIEAIVGFEKAVVTAISDADTLDYDYDATDNVVLSANANAAFNISNGVVTFTGAGPTTLLAAIDLVNTAAETAGEVAAFQYVGDTYVFTQVDGTAGAVDTVVKLTGVTGVTSLLEVGITDSFIVT